MNAETSSRSKPPPALNASAAAAAAKAEEHPDDLRSRFKRMRQSIAVVNALLKLIGASRTRLKSFAAPFLEKAKEGEPQKRTDARNARQRTAVFSVAQKALDPNNPIKKLAEDLIARAADLDGALAAQAKDVKSKVLDELHAKIAHALKDVNEPHSAEFIERFTAAVADLNGEMDARSEQLQTLRAEYQAQAKQLLIGRFSTVKYIAAGAALIVIALIGSTGSYLYLRKSNVKPPQPAAAAAAQSAAQQVNAPPAPPNMSEANAEGAGAARSGTPGLKPPAPPDASALQDEKAAASGRPRESVAAASPRAGTVTRNSGEMTISGNGNPEAIKNNAKAIVEAIKAWNAETDAENAKSKR